MKKYWSIYNNDKYKVGLSGVSVTVLDHDENIIFRISKLRHAYTGSFRPNTNMFILRTDDHLLLLDLDKQEVIKKLKIKNVWTLNDYECCFSKNGSLFYNIECTKDYEQLLSHPKSVCDGFLPMKVKDEIILSDWVYKIVIPTKLKNILASYIPSNLKDKIIYIENDCKDIWDWSEKVYRVIENTTDR